MAISPLSTLMSWGSSSILLMRKKAPTRVMRGSLPTVIDFPRAAASRAMVRNLKIKNGRNPLPIRLCLKKAGPGESSLMAPATKTSKGNRSISPVRETEMSNARFISADAPNPKLEYRNPKQLQIQINARTKLSNGIVSSDCLAFKIISSSNFCASNLFCVSLSNVFDGIDNVGDIFIGHSGVDRERNDTLIGPSGIWKIIRSIAEGIAVIGMQVQRNEVNR